MSDAATQAKELNAQLDAELAKLNQVHKRTKMIGIFILLFIFVYFSVITSQLKKNLNEENLSNILSLYAAQTIPTYTATLQKSLEDSLPRLVNQAKNRFHAHVVKQRVLGNQNIKKHLQQIFFDVNKALEFEIKRLGSPYRIKLALQLHHLSDKDRAAKNLAGIETVINQAIFTEVDHILDLSLEKIKKVEDQIEKAITNPNPDKREALIKTFITYWYNFYQSNLHISAKIGLQT